MIIFLSDLGDMANIMKGVIKTLNPDVTFMDLSNTISPYQIVEGAWVLAMNYFYFPKGSIFLCIVDPGVGSKRRAVIIQTKDYIFLGPDNGLMDSAAKDNGILRVFGIDEKKAMSLGRAQFLKRYKASKTFHGRDIFAIVAASLENKYNLQFMGQTIPYTPTLDVLPTTERAMVVSIDHYGNIITNYAGTIIKTKISETAEEGIANQKHASLSMVPKTTPRLKLQIGSHLLTLPFYTHYAAAPPKTLFVMIGSQGTLELAIKEGSAAKMFPVTYATPVQLIEIVESSQEQLPKTSDEQQIKGTANIHGDEQQSKTGGFKSQNSEEKKQNSTKVVQKNTAMQNQNSKDTKHSRKK